MNVSVLVYSCDAYSDVWQPFFTLFFKYWQCPYKVYVTAETAKCDYPNVETINVNAGTWTERIKLAVEKIPTKYVIGMCDDMFLRRGVLQNVIDRCVVYMDGLPQIANVNFEKDYDGATGGSIAGFGLKPQGRHFQKSCQPTLWRKHALVELLDCKCDPWQWEESEAPDKWDYYIFTGDIDDLVFEYGYRREKWFGIRKGKWVLEDVQPLFEREGIHVDFNERGIWK